MSEIMLIHGAWQGSWVWKEVQDNLEVLGHVVHTPDLNEGLSESNALRADGSLEGYVSKITDALEKSSSAVTLIAHSMGGIPSTVAASRLPDKVAKLIYLAAFVPCDGDSLMALTKLYPSEHQLPLILHESKNSTTIREDQVVNFFLHDAEPEHAATAKEKFRAQPLAPVTTQAFFDTASLESLERGYIICTEDRAIEVPLQYLMASRAGCAVVGEIPTGHCPFISQPGLVASLINREVVSC